MEKIYIELNDKQLEQVLKFISDEILSLKGDGDPESESIDDDTALDLLWNDFKDDPSDFVNRITNVLNFSVAEDTVSNILQSYTNSDDDIFNDDFFSEELVDFELNQFEDISIDEYSDSEDPEGELHNIDHGLSGSLFNHLDEKIAKDVWLSDLSLGDVVVIDEEDQYVIFVPIGHPSCLTLHGLNTLSFHLREWIDTVLVDVSEPLSSDDGNQAVRLFTDFSDESHPNNLVLNLSKDPTRIQKTNEEDLEQNAGEGQ